MPVRTLQVLALALTLAAQPPVAPKGPPLPPAPEEEVRLPNGKLQRDEILRAEHLKSLEDARELARLADQLKLDLEKNDQNVLPLATLKRTEEIEKLAKKIHDRLKH